LEEWKYNPTILNLGTGWRCMVASFPCLFTPGKRAPGTHWVGGLVSLRADLNVREKGDLLPCQESDPSSLAVFAHNLLLYQLSIVASRTTIPAILFQEQCNSRGIKM
jgi:hypothetical protein